jgi:carbonic anhydrase/acetyltransferase-like protein (isoleucine patch superfamily)
MNTNLINVFHRLLYGTQVDLTAQLNSFNSIAPSQGRFVTVGAYSSISTASIRASKEQPVLIGNYCTVGYCAVVEKGTVMKDQSGVAVLTRVPQNTIITENHSYLPGFMMVSKANQGPKLSISSVLYPLLVKILLVWPYWTGLGYSIAWIMIYISQPLDIIPPIFKPVVMIFISINLFLIGFVLTSLLSIWLFAQKSSKKRVTISGNSIKAALYGIVLAHQALARMFVYPFISGTILCPLIEKAGGAKIQDCSQVLMMGKAFDPNWIQIDTDNTEAFTFVADVDSIFESHRLQFGDLILEKCTIGRNVSLHSGAVAMGLVLDDGVTIAIGSKVVFANKVTSTRSGVFFGNPARECQ